MLRLDQVDVAYDGVPAVRDVSLELPDGEVLAVLGPSGCGKSSLLRAIAGIEPARGISWDDADLTRVPTHKRGFALLFQDGQLFGHLSVARNIAYPLRLRRRPRAEIAARVAELLELVDLVGYDDRLPATLSGGERQRVALARALAVRPRLLLLDEPLSALDAGLRERLAGDLRTILRAAGTTALLVTHDHEEAFAIADTLAVMRAGRIVQHGRIEEVWRAPIDAETALFLGYARVVDGALLGRGPGSLALRRSALRVSVVGVPGEPGEAGGIAARVVSWRPTPDQLRLRVHLEGCGEIDAVAPLDTRLAVGDVVRLTLDPTRTAPVA